MFEWFHELQTVDPSPVGKMEILQYSKNYRKSRSSDTVYLSVSTVSVCVFRTQQPGIESAVEGHVSSQNHMQSC